MEYDEALLLYKPESSSPKGYFIVPTLVEIGWIVLEEIFLHFVPLGTLYLNKLEFPSPKDVLCQVWLKLVQRFWRRRFFTISLKHFCFYLPLGKKQSPSIEQTWILLTQGCYVLSLVEISPVVLDKKILCVFAISLLSLLGKWWGPLYNKLEFTSPNNALCQVWLKLALWFWRRFLNFINILSLFCYYLPLEQGVVLEKKNKMWKVYEKLEVSLVQVWNLCYGTASLDCTLKIELLSTVFPKKNMTKIIVSNWWMDRDKKVNPLFFEAWE